MYEILLIDRGFRMFVLIRVLFFFNDIRIAEQTEMLEYIIFIIVQMFGKKKICFPGSS